MRLFYEGAGECGVFYDYKFSFVDDEYLLDINIKALKCPVDNEGKSSLRLDPSTMLVMKE